MRFDEILFGSTPTFLEEKIQIPRMKRVSQDSLNHPKEKFALLLSISMKNENRNVHIFIQERTRLQLGDFGQLVAYVDCVVDIIYTIKKFRFAEQQ